MRISSNSNGLLMHKEKLDPKYLETLLLYFEEEIMGEAYFYGLAGKFPEPHQRNKMKLLAEVERYAAEAVRPLLLKYDLKPRSDEELHKIGEKGVEKSFSLGWDNFISYMVDRFPGYMPEFMALEEMAPEEDSPELVIMTDHEVAAIEFANLEKHGNPDSVKLLLRYLQRN